MNPSVPRSFQEWREGDDTFYTSEERDAAESGWHARDAEVADLKEGYESYRAEVLQGVEELTAELRAAEARIAALRLETTLRTLICCLTRELGHDNAVCLLRKLDHDPTAPPVEEKISEHQS